ncbi:MAG: hypothetical protein M9939_00575 [Mesorhizobium sp.]|nr:hypothetical protein [Mesorhizobium sp.]MCO5159601.1 hypothetical protein [Mesorhizobium sp.]
MSEAGDRLIEGAKEALEIARGNQPAARIHVNGHAYVPEQRWQRMDTAPRDGTVVNVVARYPHAIAGFPQYAAYRPDLGYWVAYSLNAPQRVIPWAWRPRDDWPWCGDPEFPEDPK